MRQWVRIDPQWTDCGALVRDEFPPFPQFFRIQSNGNPESQEPLVPAMASAYVVNPCDAKGDCSESTIFGSSLDSVNESAGSHALRSKAFVSWQQKETANGTPSCSYAVTQSTLEALPPRNTLKLTVAIEEHVLQETCNPKNFVVPNKEPNCRGERTAISD
jgi:hypothetical protein